MAPITTQEEQQPDHEVFVCGRLCLFGEHSDWAGAFQEQDPAIAAGCTIVVGTQEGLHARARALDERVLHLTSTSDNGTEVAPLTLPLEEAALLQEAQRGGFFSYAAGTALHVLRAHPRVAGLRLHNHRTTLPMAKGLSSSAAICVMVARAFSCVYGLGLSVREEMELAYLGEIATPSKCGRMDQACAYGSVPVAMHFRGAQLDVEPCKLAAPLYIVLVDLGAAKDTVRILTALQSAYPHAANEEQRRLQELLGTVNLALVRRAVQAMEQGDVQAVGRLMCEAQREFDDRARPLCPDQLTAPMLHKVLAHPSLQPHIWGGKGVGSQGDGTAQLLCRDAAAQATVCGIVAKELAMAAQPLTIQANV